MVQKYRIKTPEKLDGSGTEPADLAGNGRCFTTLRNNAQGLSQSRMGGWGGYKPGRIVDRTDRADWQTILHPLILRRDGVIFCKSAGYIYGGSAQRAAEKELRSSSKDIPRVLKPSSFYRHFRHG